MLKDICDGCKSIPRALGSLGGVDAFHGRQERKRIPTAFMRARGNNENAIVVITRPVVIRIYHILLSSLFVLHVAQLVNETTTVWVRD